LRWFREQFGNGESFDGLTALAEKILPGADGLVLLPYMAGERSPIWDENAKAVFYGLDYTKTKANFIRAVLEGTAFSLRHNLETAAEAGTFANEMRAMGGAANSPLWMQIYSDITGKGIEVSSSDTATTLGAAILTGVAAGVYNNFNDAVLKTVSVKKTYKPNNYKAYETNYKIYRELYTRLKGMSQ
jgi:xylulokinase